MSILIEKLKLLIKKYLGITELESGHCLLRKQFENVTRIDSDVGMRGDTLIIITSTLANGRVEIIHKRFENLKKFENFVRVLQDHYGVRGRNLNLDLPQCVDRELFRFDDK